MNYDELAYKKALDLDDLETCMKIAKSKTTFNVDLQQLAEKVIKSKNALFALKFVKFFKPQNIKEFEKIILDSKDGYIASVFAIENKSSCDLEKFEKLILQYGDAYDCVHYVSEIESKNYEQFKQKIISEQEAYAGYLYCVKFQPYGNDLKLFEEMMVDNGEMSTVIEFAKNVYNANVLKLLDVVLEYGNTQDMIEYANLLADKYLERYQAFMKEDFDEPKVAEVWKWLDEYMYAIRDIEDLIVETGTLDDVKDFLMNVSYADVGRLQQIIENSNRKDLKVEIAKHKDVDLKSLSKSISKDIDMSR